MDEHRCTGEDCPICERRIRVAELEHAHPVVASGFEADARAADEYYGRWS